jgi:hypothetical protein
MHLTLSVELSGIKISSLLIETTFFETQVFFFCFVYVTIVPTVSGEKCYMNEKCEREQAFCIKQFHYIIHFLPLIDFLISLIFLRHRDVFITSFYLFRSFFTGEGNFEINHLSSTTKRKTILFQEFFVFIFPQQDDE